MKTGFSIIIALGAFLMGGCTKYSPKPEGYFRIETPEADYRWQDFADFGGRISEQAQVEIVDVKGTRFFFNILYPRWNARIYCSYMAMSPNQLSELSEECRKLAHLSAAQADGIRERRFDRADDRLHGLLFSIRGRTASPTQFVLTDSLRSFLRGALYFDHVPAPDSIFPVLEYINKDIELFMESLQWKQ